MDKPERKCETTDINGVEYSPTYWPLLDSGEADMQADMAGAGASGAIDEYRCTNCQEFWEVATLGRAKAWTKAKNHAEGHA